MTELGGEGRDGKGRQGKREGDIEDGGWGMGSGKARRRGNHERSVFESSGAGLVSKHLLRP